MILAIETSCDETAVAIFDLEKCLSGADLVSALVSEAIASSANLHVAYGGIVPELAAREQTVTLSPLVKRALDAAKITSSALKAIAVTSGPGLNGSLLVGLSYAKGLAYSLNIPLIPVNHLEGHLSAHQLLPAEVQLPKPFVSLLVSGGHTEVVLETTAGRNVVSKTRDDAAGEAFDKCATLLGLPYPGGPELSRLAASGNRLRFEFPVALNSDPTAFSFSGLKTAVVKTFKELGSNNVAINEQDRADLAASVENAIVRALVLKTVEQAKRYQAGGIFLTGGVAANSHLRSELQGQCNAHRLRFAVAPLNYCTDNAAMIAAAAVEKIRLNPDSFRDWAAASDSELGPAASFTLGTRTSWPIS